MPKHLNTTLFFGCNLFIVLMSIHRPVWAQFNQKEVGDGLQLQWIATESELKGAIQQRVFGGDAGGFYVYLSNGRDRLVEKYSYEGRRIFSHALPFQDRSVEVVELLVRKQDVLAYFSIYNPTYRRHGLFVQRFPFSGAAVGEPVLLLDRLEVSNPSRSEFHISADSTHQGYMVIHLHHNDVLESQLFVANFDAGHQKLRESLFRIPVEAERPVIEDLQRDQASGVVLLVRQEAKTRRRSASDDRSSAEDTLWRLWNISPDQLEFVEQVITFAGYELPELSMAIDHAQGMIRVSGLLLKPGETTPVAIGALNCKPLSLELQNKQVVALEPIFLQNLTQIRGNLREKQQTPYRMHPPILRSDGGFVLLAEAEYQTVQTFVQYSQGFPVYREVSRFHNDELVLVSVNAQGNISWRQIIPKKQVASQPSPLHSLARIATASNIHLIFNDESGQKNRINVQTVKHQGDIENSTTRGAVLDGLMLVPVDACQISPATLLIPGQKSKKFGVLRLTLQDY